MLVVLLILVLSGDIELNPGPLDRSPPPSQRQTTIDGFMGSTADSVRNPKRTRQSTPETEELITLDTIYRMIEGLDKKIDAFEARMDTRLAVVEERLEKFGSTVESLRSKTQEIEATVISQVGEISALKSQVEMLENRQRRDNLIFFKVPSEQSKETWSQSKEKIQDLCRSVDLPNVNIDRAHRLGLSAPDRPSPIVAKIPNTEDRDSLLGKWKQLGDLGIGISQDFSAKTRLKRGLLNEARKEAVAQGKVARIKFDKLFINNEIFECDESISKIISVKKYAQNSNLV